MSRTQRDNEIKIINFYFPRRVDSIRDDCVCVFFLFFLFFFAKKKNEGISSFIFNYSCNGTHVGVNKEREITRNVQLSFILLL